MSGASFNGNEALRYRVLMGLEPSANYFETLFCECIETLLLARKVNNNDDIIFFRVSTFAKPSCNNVLQPSSLRGSGCNTLPHSGLANVETRKRMFYPLIAVPYNPNHIMTRLQFNDFNAVFHKQSFTLGTTEKYALSHCIM